MYGSPSSRVFMSAKKVNLMLLLALFGMVGCSSTERLYYRPATATPVTSQPSKTATLAFAANPAATPSNVADQPTTIAPDAPLIKEPEPQRSVRDTIPAHVLRYFERRSESAENQEKTVGPSPNPTPVQTNRSLSADDRLLEQLERDLNKAVEQPKERRRLQFSKQVIENPQVRHFIKHYSTTAKNEFQALLARSGKFMPMISKVLNDEGLPEDLAYLAIVESELIVSATSRVGAVGLWQFVPSTARQYGLRIDDWVDERRDPIKSTRAAAAYLKELHSYFGRWYLVTAAYNAGPAIINKALQKTGAVDFWGIREKSQISDETRNFVPKFIAVALIASDPKKYGFNNIRYQEPLEFEEVDADGLLKIDALAEMAESDAFTIKELNPALLRNMTPPEQKGYSVRVPIGKAVEFAKANSVLTGKDVALTKVVTHEVKQGETLFSIARRYGQAVTALMELNGLTTPRLQIGQKIKILFDGIRATLR
jgi:LysM repeat protein